jgi:hypothetical protein
VEGVVNVKVKGDGDSKAKFGKRINLCDLSVSAVNKRGSLIYFYRRGAEGAEGFWI